MARSEVAVPGPLERVVVRLCWLGLGDLTRRNGSPPVVPGLARFLGELDMRASAHGVAMMEASHYTTGRWVSTSEAAQLAGISESQVRRLAADDRLIARRVGRRAWLVDADSASDYRNRRRRAD